MTDRERIGKRVAQLRKAAGLSQVELAQLSGLYASHIARIELGTYNTRIETLAKIGNALGYYVDFVKERGD